MEISLLVSIVLVVMYMVALVYKRGGLPDSMGTEVYILPDGGWRWLWSIWLWSTVYTITPKLFLVVPDSGQPCAHAFATAMLLLGVLPLLKHEGNAGVFALGFVACFFSQVCVMLINPWWLLIWLVIPLLLVDKYYGRKWFLGKYKLFIELSCYISLVSSLLIT